MKRVLLSAILLALVVGCQSSSYKLEYDRKAAHKKHGKDLNVKIVNDFIDGVIGAASENKFKLNYQSKVMQKRQDFKSYSEFTEAPKNVLLSFVRIDCVNSKFMGTAGYKTSTIYVTANKDFLEVSLTCDPAMNEVCEETYRDLRNKMQKYIDSGIIKLNRKPPIVLYN